MLAPGKRLETRKFWTVSAEGVAEQNVTEDLG